MTDYELSAAVAVARGEYDYKRFDCHLCIHEGECKDREDLCELFSPKHYASDLNAAWELVEEMEEGFMLMKTSTGWICVGTNLGCGHPHTKSYSPARAICKSYLFLKEE